jgi:hypothetical protein
VTQAIARIELDRTPAVFDCGVPVAPIAVDQTQGGIRICEGLIQFNGLEGIFLGALLRDAGLVTRLLELRRIAVIDNVGRGKSRPVIG